MGRLMGRTIAIGRQRLARFVPLRGLMLLGVGLLLFAVTMLMQQPSETGAATSGKWATEVTLAKSDISNEALHIAFSEYPITSYCGDRLMAFPWNPGPGTSNGNNFLHVNPLQCDRRVQEDGGPGAWFPNNANWMTARHSLRTASPESPWVAATATGVYGTRGACQMASGVLKAVADVDTIWARCTKFDRGVGSNLEVGVENTNANTAQMLMRSGSLNASRLGSSAVVRSAGSSLIRKVFTLTEEECSLIKDEDNVAGYRPFFEIQGDDWYIAYLNGNELIRQTFTALTYNSSTDPNFINALRSHVSCGDTEYERTNVLAIQVTDKAMHVSSRSADSSSHAAGIRYKFSIQRSLSFDLHPAVALDRASGEAGSPVGLTAQVDNRGVAGSGNVQWHLTHFTVAPGRPIPVGAVNSRAPTVHFAGATLVASGTRSFPASFSALDLGSAAGQSIGDFEFGTSVCFVLSVTPHSGNAATSWRHSTPACLVVGKVPKVQIHGGDLYVGRSLYWSTHPNGLTSDVYGKVTQNALGNYGSFAEYAIFATGSVQGFGSGSGYVGGDASNPNSLTFANSDNLSPACNIGERLGCYNTNARMPDVGAHFPTSEATLSGRVNLANVGSGIYAARSNLTLQATTIRAGHWVVINAPGHDVTIDGNIRYTDEVLKSTREIPQVIIIARNITINAHVTNVDAWLVSPGSLDADGGLVDGVVKTCDIAESRSVAIPKKCDTSLRVNGPVIANRLLLYRTAGAGTGANAGDPAEVFNLRPDAYLWAHQHNVDTRKAAIGTVYIREDAPRF